MSKEKIKFIPAREDFAATAVLTADATEKIVLGNKGMLDTVFINRHQIPELIELLTAFYLNPETMEMHPTPISLIQFATELTRLFPKVDVVDAKVIYIDQDVVGLWSTNTSKVDGIPAYDPSYKSEGYDRGLHPRLKEWVDSVGWMSIRQARGCQFFPRCNPI